MKAAIKLDHIPIVSEQMIKDSTQIERCRLMKEILKGAIFVSDKRRSELKNKYTSS